MPSLALHALSDKKPAPPAKWGLTLGCMGVVYGDIGTSPLYAFREAVKAASITVPDSAVVFGVLSLIIWTLFVIVTMKYVWLMLRADNDGEGGILSLMALAQKAVRKTYGAVFLLGMVGAALFYGDATITPAISVLSAVEGLALITPKFSGLALPLALVTLLILFLLQKRGTHHMSKLFGPVMLGWFLIIGVAGLAQIVRHPDILAAINPYYGARFLHEHPSLGLPVLGAVFLAVTGTEALYADLGHFGKPAIRQAWLFLVFPCLVLNYLGQGAFVMSDRKGLDNPFFLMMPHWALLPMVLLATLATVIASQAVITGAFSLSRQAIQLGLLPRLEIRHTSADYEGQIYMPKINTLLLYGVLFLCCVFKNSSALASAYGVAVTGTMLVTTILAYIVARNMWGLSRVAAACLTGPFFIIEAIFLWANLEKVMEGGYVPLSIAFVLILLMITWVRGTRHLYQQAHRTNVAMTDLRDTLERHPAKEVPGMAIFMTSNPMNAPVALMQNLKHNKVIHAHNIILTIETAHTPQVVEEERFRVEQISPRFCRVILTFGYAETPDVPRALRVMQARKMLPGDLHDATFFLGRRTIVSSSTRPLQEGLARAWAAGAGPKKPKGGWLSTQIRLAPTGMPHWQGHIYIVMVNASVAATDFYRIPRNQVVELGMQLSV